MQGNMRHGGQILVDQLKLQGVRRVFSVPGESFLAALDGLHESGIENIVCRHEGGACMMAEAHAKLTGQPGIVFVTRGPGATNASAGIHVARQDSTPLIMFVGQIDNNHRDREAFQEVDYRAFFTPLAKWAAEIDQTDRIPEYIKRAKDKDDPFRLMGFGHRVYKNFDPRAKIMKESADEVLDILGIENNPTLQVAKELERIALEDEYFVSKKLYPNVDFYSGIILSAMGFPTSMFTPIFALSRTVGWISQWKEMLGDPDSKIGRPRQLYIGSDRRDYLDVAKR